MCCASSCRTSRGDDWLCSPRMNQSKCLKPSLWSIAVIDRQRMAPSWLASEMLACHNAPARNSIPDMLLYSIPQVTWKALVEAQLSACFLI